MSTDEALESSATPMSDDQITQFLIDQGVGVLALPANELPYIVPMSFGYDGESVLFFAFLLFGTDSRKETLANRTERARFLSYRAESMYDWQSVSLTGVISEVADDEWEEFQKAMQNAWHPTLFSTASPMRGVQGYKFQIDEWTGIQHSTESV